MPKPSIAEAVAAAESAVAAGRYTRETWRRRARRDDSTRCSELAGALEDIRLAMRPIRSYVGTLAYEPRPDSEECALRGASEAMQRERRALVKMQRGC